MKDNGVFEVLCYEGWQDLLVDSKVWLVSETESKDKRSEDLCLVELEDLLGLRQES
jgi:hypothetical protein